MEDIGRLFSAVLSIFQLEFELYGFTFSYWEVFVFTIVAGIVAWVIGKMFLGD